MRKKIIISLLAVLTAALTITTSFAQESIDSSLNLESASETLDNAAAGRFFRPSFRRLTRVRALPVTGPNRFCGAIRWSFEDQGLTPISFRQVGAYNPESDFPDELTPQRCIENPILATIHDTVISNDPPAIVTAPDDRLQNIPLRDVPKIGGILQGGTTGLRSEIDREPIVPANPFPIFASTPDGDITLDQWASARGDMSYRCRADGTSTVRVNFANLIGNGVYSVWGVWRTTLPNGIVTSLPSPFGGVPNALVPSERGRATFRRDLPFCPDLETADGSLLLWVALAYHSDSSLYAGVPDAADLVTRFISNEGEEFESPLSLLVHHEQLAFPINITSILNGDF